MIRTNNVQHDVWDRCVVCGEVLPLKLMRIQDGRRVCEDTCFDERPNTERFREVVVAAELDAANAPDEQTDRRWWDFSIVDPDETPQV